MSSLSGTPLSLGILLKIGWDIVGTMAELHITAQCTLSELEAIVGPTLKGASKGEYLVVAMPSSKCSAPPSSALPPSSSALPASVQTGKKRTSRS